ncbi:MULTISPECIES: OmpP1/FadL family transporter [unclassified Ruegeria]|uniref:OmpP1/FadL family transporter n=1 Tax=unclassified Ruegeria TaxID=2625375 RepID=UPI0014879C43|nr:aromatic hydrocarbon degradation protein [Ruegeria sp. HKCCD8929]
MRFLTGGVSALALSATAAAAGGLDRTGQPIGIIFEEGNYAEFSIGHANPDVTGTDLTTLNPAGTPSGNIAQSFNQVAAGVKYQFNEQLSFSVIYDQPWGSDVSYPAADADFTTPGSVLLGGTEAFADSDTITGILRYAFNENWSVHGGLRYQQIDGRIRLSGAAYGPFSGYEINVDRDGGVGWLIGGAYEIPDIALRVALTYQSEIDHNFASTETLTSAPGFALQGSKETTTPQSVNLDFQTGIAQDTLLFGSIRWADHSVTSLETTPIGALPSVELIDIEDTVTFNLGVGRRFNENWSGSISFGYEDPSSDDLVSPLSPTNGFKSVSLGLQYTQGNMKVSGGVRYTDLGDAFAETGTPDVARAEFTDNDAVSFGLRVGFYF